MTLINSQNFQPVAIALGTLLFMIIVVWALWFASKMD